MITQELQLEKKIFACWKGKNVGGTLGLPYEGETGPLDLTYYHPVPDQPLANDDLDLQLVWLHHLLNHRSKSVTPETFASAWRNHVLFPWDEYGITMRNQEYGLRGAALGYTDNYFGEGMGAAIRSEIWACLAPGDPRRAAAFAWCDAVVDHAGDGVWAEVFFAAVESAAFVESDTRTLIQTGADLLPDHSTLKQAVQDTLLWWDQDSQWESVREKILRKYHHGNFTHVVPNVAITLLGWLAGKDFGDAICIAVNCGLDTDCTGATLGSILGIIDPDSIPQRWLDPIGEDVVVSEPIEGIRAPKDLSELTEWTMKLGDQIKDFEPEFGQVTPHAPSNSRRASRVIEMEVANGPKSIRTAAHPPSSSFEHQQTFFGHWIQLDASSFSDQTLILQTTMDVPATGANRLMAYYEPGVTTWLDGEKINTFSRETAERPYYIAPSFHRDGDSSVVLDANCAGKHTVTLALSRPESGTADLVIGLADSENLMWQPFAFGMHP